MATQVQATQVSLIAARITPRIVMIGLGAHLGLYAMLILLSRTLSDGGQIRNLVVARAVLRLVLTVIAYFIALTLNVEVAAEYRQARWLKFAWLALAANAGISLFRPFVESSVINRLWDQPADGPISGLLQHLVIIPANLFLLLGVLAMCWAYHRVGLGFGIKVRDYLAMGAVIILMIATLAFRQHLTQAQSPFALSRELQVFGLVILALISSVSLALHRLALQMGGGKLAWALRCLVCYVLLRAVLVLIGAVWQPPQLGGSWVAGLREYFFVMTWQVVPWLAALAAAYRAELTVDAARELWQRRLAKVTALAST
jgi:hypothetical protein